VRDVWATGVLAVAAESRGQGTYPLREVSRGADGSWRSSPAVGEFSENELSWLTVADGSFVIADRSARELLAVDPDSGKATPVGEQ
jgi:hypothetical protein